MVMATPGQDGGKLPVHLLLEWKEAGRGPQGDEVKHDVLEE
jgi:hypothetical protein